MGWTELEPRGRVRGNAGITVTLTRINQHGGQELLVNVPAKDPARPALDGERRCRVMIGDGPDLGRVRIAPDPAGAFVIGINKASAFVRFPLPEWLPAGLRAERLPCTGTSSDGDGLLLTLPRKWLPKKPQEPQEQRLEDPVVVTGGTPEKPSRATPEQPRRAIKVHNITSALLRADPHREGMRREDLADAMAVEPGAIDGVLTSALRLGVIVRYGAKYRLIATEPQPAKVRPGRRDVTAAAMGDPPPGRSALDQMKDAAE